MRDVLFVAACLALAVSTLTAPASAQPTADVSNAYARDFGVLWQAVDEHYAYVHRRQTDWDRVGALYAPLAAAAPDDRAFLNVLERAVGELYGAHAGLGVNNQVRAGSNAQAAGLRAGDSVVTVDERPVREAARDGYPHALRAEDPEAWDWALRVALAGTHAGPVRLTVARSDQAFTFTPGVTRPPETLTATLIDGRLGYLRVNNQLGNNSLIAEVDAALERFRGTDGLILDLRGTPGGGNTTVARAIMSRLVGAPQPYQRHEDVWEDRTFGVRRVWTESVMPRGPFTYTGPVAVLVGRWTGSMGEGLPSAWTARAARRSSGPRWRVCWAVSKATTCRRRAFACSCRPSSCGTSTARRARTSCRPSGWPTRLTPTPR